MNEDTAESRTSPVKPTGSNIKFKVKNVPNIQFKGSNVQFQGSKNSLKVQMQFKGLNVQFKGSKVQMYNLWYQV